MDSFGGCCANPRLAHAQPDWECASEQTPQIPNRSTVATNPCWSQINRTHVELQLQRVTRHSIKKDLCSTLATIVYNKIVQGHSLQLPLVSLHSVVRESSSSDLRMWHVLAQARARLVPVFLEGPFACLLAFLLSCFDRYGASVVCNGRW